MPPRLGLYSLADTPEDLLSQGYGMVNTEFADDPAFGGLAYNTAYNPAPYTGAMPFQNVFRISEGQYYGDLDNPSFGGSSNPRFNQFGKDISPTQDFYEEVNISPTQNFYPLDRNPTQMFYQPREFVNAPNAIDYYQPDLTTLRGLDMNRFQGVSDRSIIDERTNDEQDQNYIDQVSKNKSTGIMDLIMSIAVPGYGFLKNIGKGGLEGIRGLNQRIQQSDFAQADNLMDYLDMRKYGGAQGRRDTAARNMAQARGIQNKIDTGEYRRTGVDNVIDRGRTQESRAAATRSRDLGSMRGGVGR